MNASPREKISAVDTAWLRMDRATNLMMISGVLLLRERVSYRELLQVVEKRFLRYRRFGQRPVQVAGIWYWETDTEFDLEAHVVPIRLRGKADTVELEALVSRLASTRLDRKRPLWQFHFVENYQGGSALIVRIHHCYADGIALIQVMLSLTDAAPHGSPLYAPPAERDKRGEAEEALLAQPIAAALKLARKAGAAILEKGITVWQEPAQAVALAQKGSALTTEIAKLILMKEDSPTRFKGAPGIDKRVAWAEPLPLQEVKAIGRALQASVNDVLLSCVAGALRAYCIEKNDQVQGVAVRALVPVNLRPLDKAHRLGNKFGLVFLDLPIGIENPVERLYALRANMTALKSSYQPMLALGLLAAMGAGPKLVQDELLSAMARNATAVMTNVPGPQQPLYIAGAKIETLMFWVPQSGDIGMGVSILSYNGLVQFGLITDRGLCPDPERVIARFAPEFEKLVLTALLSPWPWQGDLDPAIAAAAADAAMSSSLRWRAMATQDTCSGRGMLP